jgi:hypothetical protein
MPVQVGEDTYDPATPVGQVRLLINDTDVTDPVFSTTDLQAFLVLEGDVVKLAAAQALDVIADDEALTSKAIRTQDLQTDGAKVADSLRKRAAALRAQVTADVDAEDYGFELVAFDRYACPPELTEHPHFWP